MVREIELKLLPAEAADLSIIRQKAADKCQMSPAKIDELLLLRRSIDARGGQPFFRILVAVYSGEKHNPEPAILKNLKPLPYSAPKAIIVGAGPAGYFAALELIERGIQPIVLDRGKDVRSRRRDLRAIQQFGIVDPNSNYCFGEGGAGTYSDGKLYTRSHKRGSIQKALQLFVEHGANADILIDAHPHIGSNKLPQIVQNIRETILHYGGEVHFENQVIDLIIREKQILGVVTNGTKEWLADAVVLATGHSARDIFELLDRHQVKMEAKPFALGLRVEHSQGLIDQIQYHQSPRDENLPASSYKLVCQVEGRGVFSFCMCPGGLVVPAATAPGEIVVNGMSMSRRDSAFANSGMVVAVELEDLQAFSKYGIFAGLEFQKSVEQAMFSAGDGSQKAPAQRLPDFIKGKISADLFDTSYIPGLFSAPLQELLPARIADRLRSGLAQFGKMMRGFYTAEANVIGTESRTSSPIRIPRHPDNLMHVEIEGLFPAGEGAGYAGGIISAAMDGQNVAKAVQSFLNP